MSILSKIFIVLLVVLAIAGSVSMLLVHRDVLSRSAYVAQLESQLEQRNIALNSVRQLADKELQDKDAVVAGLNNRIGSLEKDLTESRNALQTAVNDVAAKEQELVNCRLDSAQWSGMANKLTVQRDALQKDLSAAQAKAAALEKDYGQVSQQLIEVQAQKDFLLKRNKLQAEEIAMLRDQLEKQAAGTATASAAGAGSAVVPTIKGKITGVSDDMATVNVGKADGVEPGMRFTVFRGPDFLAELEVVNVQMDAAVGRLNLVKGPVARGDNAWNKLEEN